MELCGIVPRLTEIRRNEVLLYLGYRGSEIPAALERQLTDCMALVMKTARPRATWRIFDLQADGALGATGFVPGGNDIRQLLRDCDRAILMAVTLGAETERLLRRKQTEDMAEALILDCCCSSAVENVCDNLCDDLAEALRPRFLTDRFSPGYGDLPFAQQKEFCSLLDLPRRIGVSLTPGGLMVPQKSVTAMLGIADRPQPMRLRGCSHCGLFESCEFRKEGKTCGSF